MLLITLLKNYILIKEESSFIQAVQVLTYFRTYRVDVYTQAGFNIKNLFAVIASRLGLSSRELMFLTYQEIMSYLNNKRRFNQAIVRRRRKGKWQMLFSQGKIAFSHKAPFLVGRNKSPLTKALTGQVASPGKAQGKVRVIRGVLEFGKMKDGAILVTSMTTPDFVPIMQRSKAIITDEGGITCHAAIVSRELKIPCIIGTRIATQVLRDGDKVEVDANKGIVRKL